MVVCDSWSLSFFNYSLFFYSIIILFTFVKFFFSYMAPHPLSFVGSHAFLGHAFEAKFCVRQGGFLLTQRSAVITMTPGSFPALWTRGMCMHCPGDGVFSSPFWPLACTLAPGAHAMYGTQLPVPGWRTSGLTLEAPEAFEQTAGDGDAGNCLSSMWGSFVPPLSSLANQCGCGYLGRVLYQHLSHLSCDLHCDLHTFQAISR